MKAPIEPDELTVKWFDITKKSLGFSLQCYKQHGVLFRSELKAIFKRRLHVLRHGLY